MILTSKKFWTPPIFSVDHRETKKNIGLHQVVTVVSSCHVTRPSQLKLRKALGKKLRYKMIWCFSIKRNESKLDFSDGKNPFSEDAGLCYKWKPTLVPCVQVPYQNNATFQKLLQIRYYNGQEKITIANWIMSFQNHGLTFLKKQHSFSGTVLLLCHAILRVLSRIPWTLRDETMKELNSQ